MYKSIFNYDFEISSSAININLFNIINKLGPFGNDNFLPTFLIRDVKIIKSNEINKNHISAILKPKSGPSLKTICFNCYKSEVGNHLLSYKKKINIIAEVTKNSWNNKNIIQLNIKDLIIPVNTA